MHDDFDTAITEVAHGLKHVNGIAPKSVELGHYERLALANLPQHLLKRRSLTGGNLSPQTFISEPEFWLNFVASLLKFEALILGCLLIS
jgi:hypothetical protein